MAVSTKTRRRRLRRRDRSPARLPGPGRSTEWDDPRHGPDDLDGGAGMREPRRPRPGAPAGALALEEPTEQRLDLAAVASS
jgi:hypothetical protein